ncbi:MAG: potassium channel family protein, partial [Chloroflexota bacterium]|nr:potassium channel family protein [Chloroflexota bacterium]
MNILAGIFGLVIIGIILQDAFETIVLPRRVTRKIRLAKLSYRFLWGIWRIVAKPIRSINRREALLSYFGPLSLILLLALWAVGLIVGFALLQWALGSRVTSPDHPVTFWTDLYLSGSTFLTIGYGDVVAVTTLTRLIDVAEGGLGFGFLALIIGYVPIIYQAFSRRETNIALLDAHAGSPPSAEEFLRRHHYNTQEVTDFLRQWEQWSAELLESHLSYPVLMYYRSQHDNQSWIATLTAILDLCALAMSGIVDMPEEAARFTFAMARHAAVDLSQVLGTVPSMLPKNRLSAKDFARLQELLMESGVLLPQQEMAEQ